MRKIDSATTGGVPTPIAQPATRWPTDAEIAEAYPLAAPYVRALRDRYKIGNWRAPSGETVIDRDPLPEDFLPPAASMAMRELGDPLKPLTTSGGNDARK